MGVYNFHIFDSAGNCLFSLNRSDRIDQQKILYGFLYSLKSFTARMSPVLAKDNSFFLFSTSGYHLVFCEFPTSIKFVLILTADMRNDSDFYRELLGQLYREIYVQYIVKNPLIAPSVGAVNTGANLSAEKHNTFDCELFRNHLHIFLTQNSLL
ncbi:Trafficking protein particle complex subunit 1 [Tyrophagus putrescentiae]|nr:Trafficking protein particle complex subunit 1 [Tyrophagus putrescentiae]